MLFRSYRAVLAGEVDPAPLPLPPPPPWKELVEARWPAGRVLPWQHLACGLPESTLWRHHQEALGPQEAAQAGQEHPAGDVDATVIHGNVRGVEDNEHQGGGPPGAIEAGPAHHSLQGASH